MTFRELFESQKEWVTHLYLVDRKTKVFCENLTENGCCRCDEFDASKLTDNIIVELIYRDEEVINSVGGVKLDDDVYEVMLYLLMDDYGGI